MIGSDEVSIQPDLDAFSVVVSTNDLNPQRKSMLRNYLLSFGGSSPSTCNFPQLPVASKTKDSMFGCCGNKSQHLPELLQGNEMLVIDCPVKLALHSSCRDKLISQLSRRNYFYKAAEEGSGLCFHPRFASTKPPYSVLVDAVLDSCTVSPMETGQYNTSCSMIHVGNMGFRLPITSNRSMGPLLDHTNSMKSCGLKFEILQLDIAFVLKAPADHLIVASKSRNPKRDSSSLLQGTKTKVFPLHRLPEWGSEKIKSIDVEGTILVKKDKWDEDNLDINITDGSNDEITDLYLCNENSHRSMTREEIEISSSSIHSVKGYSTISHVQLQPRNQFPLSLKSMYGIGERSIETLQTLVLNVNKMLHHSFSAVREHGIGFRIEVSIRPPEQDSLRYNGHFNDFLMLACLVVKEFCNRENKPKLSLMRTRGIETQVMRLSSEVMSMIRYRQEMKFKDLYPEHRVTDWLRYQLSRLLITMGISPSYGVKYMNDWIGDSFRFDPFHHMLVSDSIPKSVVHKNALRQMLSSLSMKLRKVGFSSKGMSTLVEFIEKAGVLSSRDVYTKLSFQDKHLLSNVLFADIIPEMSKYLSSGNSKMRKEKDNKEEGVTFYKRWRNKVVEEETFEHEDDNSPRWWEEYQSSFSLSTIDEMIEKCPMPDHPLSIGIVLFLEMSTLWNPKRVGFMSIVSNFILGCHECSGLGYKEIVNVNVTKLLSDSSRGEMLSRDNLKLICSVLLGHSRGSRNLSQMEYMLMLCHHYQFPMSGKDLREEASHAMDAKNKVLNSSLFADVAVIIGMDSKKTLYYRNMDNVVVDVPHQREVMTANDGSIRFDRKLQSIKLYFLLTQVFVCPGEHSYRLNLHDNVSELENLQTAFLDSSGHCNGMFEHSRTLSDLEQKHNFLLLWHDSSLNGMVMANKTIPEVILPMSCLTFQRDLLFINQASGSSTFYKYMNNRSIMYSWNSCDVKTKVAAEVIVQREDSILEWMDVTTKSIPVSKFVGSNTFQSTNAIGMKGNETQTALQGMTVKKINLSSIPNRKRGRKGQSFYSAMLKQMSSIDPDYIEGVKSDEDSLGLLSFMEELSVMMINSRWDSCFHPSVTENCAELKMPLKVLAKQMKENGFGNYNHNMMCPIACMKYSNMIIGVHEYKDKCKSSYFYALNQQSLKVECRKEVGYCLLSNCSQVLYYYTSEAKTDYYLPQDLSSEMLSWNKWQYVDSIKGIYSHLSIFRFEWILMRIQEACDMSCIFFRKQLVESDYRPEPPDVAIIPFSVVSKSNQFQYFMKNGNEVMSVLIIFPATGGDHTWDACVIHHPEVDEIQMKDAARYILKGAPPGSNYTLHAISGLLANTCESSFYTLFYIYLGSRCKTLVFFFVAMDTLKKQTCLWMKIKEWLHFILVHKKKPSVPWLSDSTLNSIESRVAEFPFIESDWETSISLDKRNDSKESILDGQPTRKRKLGGHNVSQRKRRILNGIINEGNMCYMIVILQMMYPMRVIRDACSTVSTSNKDLLSSYGDKERKPLREIFLILEGLQDVFNSMNSTNAPVSISKFKNHLTSTRLFNDFDNSEQHDSHHLLIILLNLLCHSSCIQTSAIKDAIQSTVDCHLQCSSCGMERIISDDKSNILELFIAGTTLQECWDFHFKVESVNDWMCNCCKTKTIVFKQFHYHRREILILTLKRYNAEREKVTTVVDFPINGFEVSCDSTSGEENTEQIKYDLFGVINHMGNDGDGHYTVYLKRDGCWHEFNDHQVSGMEEKEIVSQHAYILIFVLGCKYNDLID